MNIAACLLTVVCVPQMQDDQVKEFFQLQREQVLHQLREAKRLREENVRRIAAEAKARQDMIDADNAELQREQHEAIVAEKGKH